MIQKKIFFNKIINFLIEALLITNIWIFLFNHLLNFLNREFPAPPVTNFIIPGAFPEPFEIPLYLFLSMLFVFIIYLIRINRHYLTKVISYYPDFFLRFNPIFKLVLFFGLLLTFINNLGTYPMGNDVWPLTIFESSQTNLIYLAGYLSVIFFITFESVWLKYLVHKRKFFFIFYLCLTILIAALTLKPNFVISWHDYPYIFGPVFEIAHGKTIFTQTSSQYGFLMTLFLVVLYKLSLINLPSLPIFVWLLYVLQYSICFYLIYKISRSFILAFIGLFSIITINYYSLCCTIAFPQIGPLRWLPIIFLVFLLYKLKKIDSYWFILALSLLSFWVVDVGIAILLAYSFSLLLFALVKIINFKILIRDYFLLGLTITGIFFLINLIGFVFGYQMINIMSIFSKLREYSQAGFGMLPITIKTFFWFTLFVYFASVIYFFQRKQYIFIDQMLLFSANLTLFASVYYVGRSHPLNLFVVSIFPLLTFIILISRLYTNKIVNKSFLLQTLTLVLLFLTLIVYPAYSRKEMLTINLKEELTKKGQYKNIFDTGIDVYLNSYFGQEINLINKYLPEKNILIISTDDSYLLYLTHKASLLNMNPLTSVISQNDVDFSLKNVYQTCPKKIAVDCDAVGKCPFFWKLNYFIYPYQVLLNRISQHCNFQYKPGQCTNQLCIAIAD